MSRTHLRKFAVGASVVFVPLAFAFVATSLAPEHRSARDSAGIAAGASATTPSIAARAGTAAATSITTAALTPTQAGADPFFVEPRVPQAAGAPCVDTVATNLEFVEFLSVPQFQWTPNPACGPGPWAKIIVVVETTGARDISAATMRVHLSNANEAGDGPQPGGGVLFLGTPLEHDGVPTWRFERDLTEYAEALRRPISQLGYATAIRDNFYHDFDALAVGARSVKLLYYPPSAATPAQRSADVMRSLDSQEFLSSASWLFSDLPRNIERAYLDVMARPFDPARMWHTCVPTEAVQSFPQLDSRFGMGDFRPFIAGLPMGCDAPNGSYREVEVLIDGQLAGLAPVFPSLASTINFTSAVDAPAPSVQSLNIVPYRVDLTPFAALLNDGQPHAIIARMTNSPGGALVTGQLLLFVDKGRSVVTGALTRNTLANQPSVAAVTHTLTLAGDVVSGNINTFLRRAFNIEGYVDTSAGRVRSTVYQVSRFANTQTLRVQGPNTGTLPRGVNYAQTYVQKVRLSNTVDRVTRRIRGTTLLSEDKDYVSYPLTLDYAAGGEVRWFEGLAGPSADHYDLDVHQARAIRATHFRIGTARYDTSLADVFDGHRHWLQSIEPGGTNTDWRSARRYLFTDNRGSCYSAGLTTSNGELQTRTRGTECPTGRNGLRWFAHPDGSPEGMLWAANP